jgi:RimJ/RimL family protein N-acetyltransferase
MAKSPIIETERLRIRPFSEEHLTLRYVSWLSDPEVVKYSEQRHLQHTLESCNKYRLSFDGTPNFFWAIESPDSEIGHLGNINAYVDEEQSSADIGILIGEKKAWKKGYGREAWEGVVKYLFVNENISRITAGTLEINAPMIGVMNAVGMRPDLTRKGDLPFNGKVVALYFSVLHRDDFLSRESQK